jgi:hypothetical protein
MAVALALLILVGTAGRRRIAELARDRRAWGLVGVITVAGLTSTAWTILMKATGRVENPIGPRFSVADSLSMVFVEGIPFYLHTMVGQFGWLDFEMPGSFHALWLGSLGFLVLAALAAGKPVDRIRLGLVIAGTFAILLTMDVFVRHHNGIPVQGRYVLPVAVGVALVAAYTIGERELLARPSARAVTAWLALAVLPAHLIGLAFTMIRYQHGLYTETIPPVNPFTGEWHPELGSATALVTAVTGLAVLGAAIWLGIRDARPSGPGAPEEGSGDDRLHLDRGDAPEHVGELS